MTPFQIAVIGLGTYWRDRDCWETTKNGGACIDEVQIAFSGRTSTEAYCAKFAWIVIEAACKEVGVKNPLPRTAGARDMRDRSIRAGLRVDTKPGVGSVFYRKSSVGTGHVGVVTAVSSTGITTIEGNAGKNSDHIGRYTYSNAVIQTKSKGYVFIHVEDVAVGRYFVDQAGFGWWDLALVGSIGISAFLLTRGRL